MKTSKSNQTKPELYAAPRWIVPNESYEEMSQRAADLIAEQVRLQPGLMLCAAAGVTPTHTYALLAQKGQRNPLLFGRLQILKLDEWGGLDMADPGTCEVYLQQHVLGPLGIDPDRYTGFHSNPSDPNAECDRITALLGARPPIDLCILGLGANGHLGLNEPSDSLTGFAHVAVPAESSLKHSMLKLANGKPSFGLTLGMADILSSRKILLLVNGDKRQQLERLRSPQISTWFPASFLWLHQDVTCLYVRDPNSDFTEQISESEESERLTDPTRRSKRFFEP